MGSNYYQAKFRPHSEWKKKPWIKQWLQTDVLILDEVSMLNPDLLELLNLIGKTVNCEPYKAFGGMQVVCSGDFFQLPPVEPDKSRKCAKCGNSLALPEALAWEELGFNNRWQTFLLHKVWRQSDQEWVDILGKLKYGEVNQHVKQYLENLKRPLQVKGGIKPTRLYTHRADANYENQLEFSKLPFQMYPFEAVDSGEVTI
ncbi:hypothetical protein BDZ91DRAFT_663553, partial [Kalaharituber pfeilii]